MLTCLNDYHLIDDNFYIDDNFDLQLPLASRYEQGHSEQAWRDLAVHPVWEEELGGGGGGGEFGRSDQERVRMVVKIKGE